MDDTPESRQIKLTVRDGTHWLAWGMIDPREEGLEKIKTMP